MVCAYRWPRLKKAIACTINPTASPPVSTLEISLPIPCVEYAAYGGLGERFKPAVLKTADSQGSVSSNLTASAKNTSKPLFSGAFLFLTLVFLPYHLPLDF